MDLQRVQSSMIKCAGVVGKVDIKVHPEDELGNIVTLLKGIRGKYNGLNYRVPKGFESDGVSTPSFLWPIISPPVHPHTIRGGIIHDWIYRHQPKGWTREDADNLFADVIEEDGLSPIQAQLAYAGLRLFGDKAWKANAKRKEDELAARKAERLATKQTKAASVTDLDTVQQSMVKRAWEIGWDTPTLKALSLFAPKGNVVQDVINAVKPRPQPKDYEGLSTKAKDTVSRQADALWDDITGANMYTDRFGVQRKKTHPDMDADFNEWQASLHDPDYQRVAAITAHQEKERKAEQDSIRHEKMMAEWEAQKAQHEAERLARLEARKRDAQRDITLESIGSWVPTLPLTIGKTPTPVQRALVKVPLRKAVHAGKAGVRTANDREWTQKQNDLKTQNIGATKI